MLPTTGAALLAFLLLIVPGLLFELIRESRKPTPSRSSLREGTWVLFVGAMASAGALLVLAIARAGFSWSMPDPRLWLAHPVEYQTEHYRLVARTLALGFFLACALGAVAGGIAIRIDKSKSVATRVSSTPALFTALYRDVKGTGKPVPFVTVHTTAGVKYMGVAVEVDPAAAHDEGWLVLEQPLRRFTVANVEDHSVADWHRLALRYGEIAEVWIRHVVEAALQQPLDQGSTDAERKG
ncbi:MAG TPA: DUF6338 family protein [Acidimicrobiales bacterium]|nr:DUF6338 family protein [Acidimicrobiales bacterium]